MLGPFPPPLPALRALLRLAPAARAALGDARSVAGSAFETKAARALFAGLAGHSMLPLERRPSAGFAIALAVLAHVDGWGFPRGGAQAIADGLVRELGRAGGEVHTDSLVDELPSTDVVLADVVPAELRRIARLPERFDRALGRYRHGPGAFKLDWALDGPIPWRAPRVRARRDRPPRRDVRRDRRLGVGRLARPPGRAALRDPGAAHALRSEPRSGGEAHRLGVLPRPERLGRRHDEGGRGAGRALRAGLPRARSRASREDAGRLRGAATATSSAATSAAARSTSARRGRGRCAR